MADPVLLNDEALQGFIREGYITLQSELPHDYHDRMWAALDDLEEGGPRGHNNLLPCVPELSRMLDEPVVRGALESILGPGYYLHFHRHDHFDFLNAAQPLHKDGDNHSHLAVDGLRRMHRTRFAMLFYYPQDTPLEKGPTGIVPRSQYVPRRALEAARARMNRFNKALRARAIEKFGADVLGSAEARAWQRQQLEQYRADNPEQFAAMAALDEPWEKAKIPLLGDAGTVNIVHFDMVHGRHSANVTDESRHMVKFLFTRDRDPVGPSWRHGGAAWPAGDDPMTPVWRSLWDWHRGAKPDAPEARRVDQELTNADDHVALGAAYSLGMSAAGGGHGLTPLMEAFLGDDVGLRTVAAYGLVAAGGTAVTALASALANADPELRVRVIDVLGDIGAEAADALPRLIDAMRDDDPNVRRYAVEAVGTVAQGRPVDAQVLNDALSDEDAHVRRNAAMTAARLGPDLRDDDVLVPPLADNLQFWHHHVRGWSIEALQRLKSPEATRVALRYLMTARWDHAPKSGDTPLGARAPRVVAKAAA